MTADFWRGKRVLVTGHTGFKGGWLSVWLQALGAEVHGIALAPPTEPNFFTVARVEENIASSSLADIRDAAALSALVKKIQPEIVLHLAAQPLVRASYRQPIDTYSTNVMGVVHLLEAVRATGSVKAVLNVTTDKCYENRERSQAYVETDAMGGFDPYSSSKACAELVTAAYRSSFLSGAGVAVATARAGNVIGGGDWAQDRLLPDFFRAGDVGQALTIRYPAAIRPWQHVLEPLAGYLMLAERLHDDGTQFAESWNFGPPEEDAQTVGWIADYLMSRNPNCAWQRDASAQPHEAHYLKLDSGKARARLGWQPRWRLQQALDMTLAWHRAWRNGEDMHALTRMQIDDYLLGAEKTGERTGDGAH